MSALLRHGLARLRLRSGRALLAAGGIAAAAAAVGAAATVAYELRSGFDRAAARAGLADATAQFDPRPRADVDARVRALPNLRAAAYRLEAKGEYLQAGGRRNEHAKLEGIEPGDGPRGYAVVAGRDLAGPEEVVIERGLAREWHLGPGAQVSVYDYRNGGIDLRVVGVAVAPDDVAFPLTKGPRLYMAYDLVRQLSGASPGDVNVALLWSQDRSHLDLLLEQARTASFGLTGLTIVTRAGVRALIDGAAGIVIRLLIAFALVVVATTGVVLTASSSLEVRRRVRAVGLLRALGASRGTVAARFAAESALVAAPAALVGIAVGAAAVSGSTGRLLAALNELAPGASLLVPLALCWLAVVAATAAAAAAPAWRAASGSPIDALRRGDVVATPTRLRVGRGALGLGLRLALSRPRRALSSALVLGATTAVALLLLSLASLLHSLEQESSSFGRRYTIAVVAPSAAVGQIRRVPGVAAATTRYETNAVDSFDLGRSFELVAFGADHARYDAPALAAGRRAVGAAEAEVGLGLAQALGLSPGSVVAAQLLNGREARFRVVGIVRVLQNEGQIAYVGASRLLAADPTLQPEIAVLTRPGANLPAVRAALAERGYPSVGAGGVVVRNGGFLRVLAALLRAVAVVVGLVSLYVLVQTLALTSDERRAALSVARAVGASPSQVLAILGGVALALVALAAPLGVVAERALLGPAASRLAASYVTLDLVADVRSIAAVVAGLVALALLAAALVARSLLQAPIVAGLEPE